MEHTADNEKSRFNLIFVDLVEDAVRKSGKIRKEIAAELGMTRQFFWAGENQRRAVGIDVVTRLCELAGYTKGQIAEVKAAWLRDRIDSGALGKAMDSICDYIDGLSEPERHKIYTRAVTIYAAALETKRK